MALGRLAAHSFAIVAIVTGTLAGVSAAHFLRGGTAIDGAPLTDAHEIGRYGPLASARH